LAARPEDLVASPTIILAGTGRQKEKKYENHKSICDPKLTKKNMNSERR
jgi:hypothetical protein